LAVALVLNVALILFGWRRSKDLKAALEAYERSERQATRNANTDSMTGLANRRELLHSLGDALEARRPGALLLLDLDHFKRVNDLHGHLAGDQVLKTVSEALTRAAPDAACCARIGGDEFAVLLDGESAGGERAAEKIAEAILADLANPVFAAGAQLHVSASIGIASLQKFS